MRRIKLTQITLPTENALYTRQTMYCVSLGNGLKFTATNYKEAKRFVSQVNRFLNDQLQQINWCYGHVFFEYRQAWFYIDPQQQAGYQMDSALEQSFRNAEGQLRLAVSRSHWTNGNYTTFQQLQSACNFLHAAIDVLTELYMGKKYLVECQRLQMIRNNLSQVKERLSQVGHDGQHLPG